MNVGIMQPYFFPYLGYFQLIRSVDHFIFLNDVNYTKCNWINRNFFYNYSANKKLLFTIPVRKASQNKKINEIEILDFKNFKNTFLKILLYNYKKAPFFDETFLMLSKIVENDFQFLEDFNRFSICEIKKSFGYKDQFHSSSNLRDFIDFQDNMDNIIKLANNFKCTTYLNPIGGTSLYFSKRFSEEGIALKFLKTKHIEYKQFTTTFLPNLSIIDVLMFNSIPKINELLDEYELITI